MASPKAYDPDSFSSLSPACRAAAAAARRKRRKALVRRNQSPHRHAKRTKTGSPIQVPQQQISSKRPLPNATTPQQPQQEPTSVSSSAAAASTPITHHRSTSSRRSKSANMIQPTLQGMQQVATNLSTGQVVALPTECTYEVATQLDWSEPNSWNNRIQGLYHFCGVHHHGDDDGYYDDEDDAVQKETMLASSCSSGSTATSTTTDRNHGATSTSDDVLNQHSAAAAAAAVSVTSSSTNSLASYSSTDTRSSPTPLLKSSAPSSQPKKKQKSQPMGLHALVRPHVYVPHPSAAASSTSLDDSSSGSSLSLSCSLFWRQCFPKRPYAVRNKQGEVLAAHAFNETLEVWKLLSSKLWPGPVVIYVAVDHLFAQSAAAENAAAGAVTTIGAPSTTSNLTVQRNGKRYLALRSLCHPLMVKVHQEYLKTTTAETTRKNGPCLSSPGSSRSPDHHSNGTGLTSPTGSRRRSEHVLVGMALPAQRPSGAASTTTSASNQTTAATDGGVAFVERASQVVVAAATNNRKHQCSVLNGEAQADVFCVPTCEYGQPCPVSLWLDATERQIVIVRQQGQERAGRESAAAATSSRHANNIVTGQQLLQILKSLPPPKTGQDRVIQAVLNRWRVKEEEEEEVVV